MPIAMESKSGTVVHFHIKDEICLFYSSLDIDPCTCCELLECKPDGCDCNLSTECCSEFCFHSLCEPQ